MTDDAELTAFRTACQDAAGQDTRLRQHDAALLYQHLATFLRPDRARYVEIRRTARTRKFHKDTVKRALKLLLKCGYLRFDGHDAEGLVGKYLLTLPDEPMGYSVAHASPRPVPENGAAA